MLAFSAAVVIGIALLVWSSDRFIMGAALTARHLGVSSLVVGLTIVALGTSAPEMLVSAMAAFADRAEVGIGNALGSNITNTALVLGVTAFLIPLAVNSATLRRELPVLFAIMGLAVVFAWDLAFTRIEGILLMIGLLALIGWMVWLGLHSRGDDPISAEYEAYLPTDVGRVRALVWLVAGLVVLLISARMLVWGAVGVARELGVSDLVIGLSVVAVGTSLPELAASVTSAVKREPDIAIGNVIGSNMFNLLGVMGLPALIAPGGFSPEVLRRDLPVMIGLTALLYIMCRSRLGPTEINRFNGLVLVALFVGYQVYIYYDSLPS